MKKVIFIVMAAALVAWPLLGNQEVAAANEEAPVSMQARKCSCGGDLEFTYKAYQITKKCVSCGGKGKLYGGNTCNNCNGTGKVHVWKSGYVCKSCGKIYK